MALALKWFVLIVNVFNPRQPIRKSAGGALFVITLLLYFLLETLDSSVPLFYVIPESFQKVVINIKSTSPQFSLLSGEVLCFGRLFAVFKQSVSSWPTLVVLVKKDTPLALVFSLAGCSSY